ncbi:MAG: ABC transporter ATP-binding protein [Saprospiraceae bacterium]|nr:ABC transporter ATP-binding protein [Saprospiraceae bacterium]
MINLQNLDFRYRKGKNLFEDLNLQLRSGNIYGLLGKNGAGKTTLLRLINGFLFPTKGTVDVLGFDATDRHPEMLADVCYVQEEPYIPDLSIIAYLYTYAPFILALISISFFSLITEFGLEGHLKMESFFWSKEKVMLSFALASNARIVILDEPTNGLDIPSKSQFRKLITEAMLDDRIVIISTHQVRDMVNLIDPILILEEGKIIFHYSLEEIANALYFEVHHSMTEPANVIYSERISGGYLSIRENTEGLHSNVDVEVLFNAILMKKDLITGILEKSKSRIKQS